MSELQQRKVFSRQPGILYTREYYGIPSIARAVLVDFRPPMDGGTCLNMLQALSDTLMLVNHVTGPSRVPLFSLIALGLYPEVKFVLWHSRDAVVAGIVSIAAS